jgi:formylglycine-generating enzyme required for sulfatase activity
MLYSGTKYANFLTMKLITTLAIFLAWAVASPAQTATTVSTNKPTVVTTNSLGQLVTNTVPQVPGDIYTNSVGMELVKVGAYWAGKYEVTQKQYKDVMNANPSQFSGNTLPVDSVCWNDAMGFCTKLTALELETNAVPEGFYYTLPTEAEWTSLVGDADLKDAVSSLGNPRGSSSPVGSLGPNSSGLYDTRGNVSEFCLGELDKPFRVLRGGSWADFVEVNLRLDFRVYVKPDETRNTYGIRVLLKQK